jgi:hypothetical protein
MGNIKTANQSDKRTSDDMMMQGFTKNFKGAGVNKQTSLKYEHTAHSSIQPQLTSLTRSTVRSETLR